MGPYHVMLAHFPIALWSTAAAIVLLRFLSDGKVARAADGALSFILFLGAISRCIDHRHWFDGVADRGIHQLTDCPQPYHHGELESGVLDCALAGSLASR